MRFSGIAAAIVGRFSTAHHHPIRFSLCVSPSPVPLQPALFPTLYHPSPPLQSSRPRLARPFDMVYASGIQMTAFARAEECPTISAWLRPPTTTRLHRGIRSLVSSFFFPPPLPFPPSPPVLRHAPNPATCYCVPTSPLFRIHDRFHCILAAFSKGGHARKPIQTHFFRLIRSRDSL